MSITIFAQGTLEGHEIFKIVQSVLSDWESVLRLVIRSIELNITFSTRPSIKTIRSLGLSNLFSRIEIRTNGFNRGNDLELQNELFKSIAVREKELLYSRDRIAYP